MGEKWPALKEMAAVQSCSLQIWKRKKKVVLFTPIKRKEKLYSSFTAGDILLGQQGRKNLFSWAVYTWGRPAGRPAEPVRIFISSVLTKTRRRGPKYLKLVSINIRSRDAAFVYALLSSSLPPWQIGLEHVSLHSQTTLEKKTQRKKGRKKEGFKTLLPKEVCWNSEPRACSNDARWCNRVSSYLVLQFISVDMCSLVFFNGGNKKHTWNPSRFLTQYGSRIDKRCKRPKSRGPRWPPPC